MEVVCAQVFHVVRSTKYCLSGHIVSFSADAEWKTLRPSSETEIATKWISGRTGCQLFQQS